MRDGDTVGERQFWSLKLGLSDRNLCFYSSAVHQLCVPVSAPPLALNFHCSALRTQTTRWTVVAKSNHVRTIAKYLAPFLSSISFQVRGSIVLLNDTILFRFPLAYFCTRALFLILHVGLNGCFGLKHVVHLTVQILFLLYPSSPSYHCSVLHYKTNNFFPLY